MTIETYKTSSYSLRRLLSPDEIQAVDRTINETWLYYLSGWDRETFISISKQFRQDYRLSDKQIAYLRRFKRHSDTEYHKRKATASKKKKT